MEKEEFLKEMEWFLEYYEVPMMNETRAKVWFSLCQHVDVRKFRAALKHHIKTDHDPHFPAYGKINYSLNSITVQG